nr:hypothetical protein [Tanacetum cinerariifolium]
MVAFLERTYGNDEFHQIVDFLTSSQIHYALNTQTSRRTKRVRDTEIPPFNGPPKKVGDEAVYTGDDNKVVRVATTAASLEAEQESGTINKTQPTATLNESSPQGISSGSRPREDSMEHQDKLTDFIPPTPHDSPLRSLQKKVKRLEKKQRERTPGMKLFNIGTSKKKTSNKENDVNTVEPVSTAGDAVNAASFILDVSVVDPSTSVAGPSISIAEDIFKDDMTTMADTLMCIRRTRPRTTSVVIHDVKEEPRRTTPPPIVQSQDTGKGKMVEPEPISKNPIKAQIQRDVEIAQRKRFSVAQRAEQIRNKPPTKAQLRNKIVTYLKHMGMYTHNQLKSKSFKEIQVLYEREQKWINDFVPMDYEEVNDSKQQAERRNVVKDVK